MVPWGTGDPISSGYLNTLVFLTEKPPPLSVSEGGGSMSLMVLPVYSAYIIYYGGYVSRRISQREDMVFMPTIPAYQEEKMNTYGYVRVSSIDQNEDRQMMAMEQMNIPISHVYVDKQSGKDFDRPEYGRMIRILRSGDLLCI